MKKETIIIQQEINISYETENDKKLCLDVILRGTNWIAFKENTHGNYGASKTKDIKLIEDENRKI